MNGLVRLFYRVGYWIVPWWYGFTMTLTRKQRYPEVATYTKAEDIAAAVQYGRLWRPDPLRERLDVMMSPRKFQALIDSGGTVGDCDDHAIYWATALLKSGLADRAYIGTVWHAKPDGSSGSGHALCVFDNDQGRWWADYHKPAHCIEWGWVRQEAAARGKVPIAAGMFEVSIRKSGEPRLHKRVRRWFP